MKYDYLFVHRTHMIKTLFFTTVHELGWK